jgi:hypothetical protein
MSAIVRLSPPAIVVPRGSCRRVERRLCGRKKSTITGLTLRKRAKWQTRPALVMASFSATAIPRPPAILLGGGLELAVVRAR